MFHIFSGPSTAVGHERMWWKYKPDRSEKSHHLPGHRLNIILASGNEKPRHFVLYQCIVGDGLLILHTIHLG